MADDEIVIKIRVDDDDLKKIKSKGQQEILPDSTKSVLPKGTKGASASKSAMGGFGIGQATQGLGMAKGGVMNPIGLIQNNILPMLTKFLPKTRKSQVMHNTLDFVKPGWLNYVIPTFYVV